MADCNGAMFVETDGMLVIFWIRPEKSLEANIEVKKWEDRLFFAFTACQKLFIVTWIP